MTSFYRNVVQIEILSNEPWGDEAEDLEEIRYQIMDGHSSGAITRIVANQKLTREQAAAALKAQGSDPDFLDAGMEEEK
jgi:hypothetical protein